MTPHSNHVARALLVQADVMEAHAAALRLQAQALDAEPASSPETFVDAVQYLRALPRRSVLAACRSGAFPCTKHGRRWVARASDLDAWLQRQAEPANDVPTLSKWKARAAGGEK